MNIDPKRVLFCVGCNNYSPFEVDHTCGRCGAELRPTVDKPAAPPPEAADYPPYYGGADNPTFTITDMEKKDPAVDHPSHYQAKNDPNGVYEAIKVIDAWELGFCLGNVVKYISRAGKKTPDTLLDLKKAAWYLNHEIEQRSK